MVTWYVMTKDHGTADGWTLRSRETSLRNAHSVAYYLRLDGWETKVACHQ